MNYSDKLKDLKIQIEEKNNDIKMINVDEYIKNNISLENYDDEIKNLMIKIEHEQEKIYNKKEVKTLNLNDFKEYNRSISEMYMKIRGSEKYESYKLFFEEHSANAYINKTLIGMTSSDINTLKELMDPHTKNFILYEGYSVASNPNATPEMLRELSKHFDNTAELIENPNTPIDVLEKYKKIFDNEEYSTGDKEIYERANERLQERQQDSINVIENFLQDLNKEDVISSMANVDLNNTDPISNLNERINHVKQSLNELSSDNKEIYTNKVLNAVSELNKKILNKAMPEPEHDYDFER